MTVLYLHGFASSARSSKAAFFARLLLREQPLCVPGEFEKLDALVHVGLLGVLVAFDVA